MDACAAVDKDLEHLISKFTLIHGNSDRVISSIVTYFEDLKASIREAPADGRLAEEQIVLMQDALKKTKNKLQKLATEHREVYAVVKKVGKVIDRNFTCDLSSTTRNDVMVHETNIQLLNKIIAQHFYRQGMDDVADVVIQEAGLSKEEIYPEPYADLHCIWESIHNRDLKPALDWASRYSLALTAKNSSLEFKLHRLAFVQIVASGLASQWEAIQYARKNFSQFASKFEKEIQILMGTLIYLPVGIDKSPYKNLNSPEMWIEAADTFLKDACITLRVNRDSPLSVVINAGCKALPALLNLKQVILPRQVSDIWNSRDELPIEIDLEHRYHSIFSCPILRQQSSDENPPMKLTCGHVISRDALNKLSTGQMLKCPYCTMEQNPNEAKLIYF